MQRDKGMQKREFILSFFLLIISMFCAQIICYFYLDEFMRFYATSMITFFIPRIIITLFIYTLLDLLVKKNMIRKRQKIFLFLLYCTGILTLTFKPVSFRGYNLMPFTFLKDLQMYTNQIYLFLGNVFLYVPVGFVLCRLTKDKKRTQTFIVISILLCSIEAVQFVCKLGVFDIDDILLNFAGFAMGYFICVLYNTRRKVAHQ